MDPLPGVPDPGSADSGDHGKEHQQWGVYGSDPAELEAGGDEDGPFYAWLPPEDRLWRHPSEGASAGRPRLDPPRRRIRPAWPARSTLGAAVLGGVIGALVVAVVGTVTGFWPRGTTIVQSVLPSSPTVSLAEASAGTSNWTAVDDAVAPSVVSVTVDGPSGLQQGSGLVLISVPNNRAFIVTDRAIFSPAESAGYTGTIDVTFLTGSTDKGRLIGQDPLTDLAVVEVDNAPGSVAAVTGTVADLTDANSVLAVGARTVPSLSTGSVSGEDRTVPLSNGTDIDDLIALAMPTLSPAASGGPLLDQYGRVVGITIGLNPTDAADQALTFAVPIDEAVRVASQIIDSQPVTHPWTGIRDAADVPPLMAHRLGLSGGVQAGEVAAGSPADQAGINADDIITSFGGKPVSSAGQLISYVANCEPGGSVVVTYLHGGQSKQTVLQIGSEPFDG